MIKILLACSERSFLPWYKCPFIGRLITPVLKTDNFFHSYTAMDNFAYSSWNEKRFFKMLMKNSHRSSKYKWVACPDVVGDSDETLKRFKNYEPRIRSLGYNLAYVLQDGVTLDKVPFSDISAVFVGGTTDFKLSDTAYEICKIAVDKNKLVHIGRVNSIKRIERFLSVADSFDGLSFSYYSKSRLPNVLRWLYRHVGTEEQGLIGE